MKKVSIIVPIYNAEKYLKECLESLVNQTYNNFEIILINDGSIDNSSDICKEYIKIYDNIIYQENENHGVSYSRNFGIKLATGEYIAFVDSDDYIEHDMITNLLKEFNRDIDMVVCNYICDYQNGFKKNIYNYNNLIDAKETQSLLFNESSIKGFCWNKIYKKSIIDKYNLEFREDINVCEDSLFNYQYLEHSKNIYICGEYKYHYRVRKSSITNFYNSKDITFFKIYDEIYKTNHNIYDDSINFYSYSFFKYEKVIKQSNIKILKINYFDCIKNKNISKRTKLMITYFHFCPTFLKKIIEKIKQNYGKLKYFE